MDGQKGARPIITINGTRQKTIVFGAFSHDGRQFFRQYDKFDQYCFLDYLKKLHRKFGEMLVYADRDRNTTNQKL